MRRTMWTIAAGGALLVTLACSGTKPPAPPQSAAAPFVVDRTVLPIPEPNYPHETELDARKATPPPRFEVKAPEGAPNVLIVLIDDMGFGISSAFGGPVHMPTADRLAQAGLRYNQASFTGTCSAELKAPDGSLEQISFSKAIVATGGVSNYDGFAVDGETLWTTEDALDLKAVPRSLAIVGAGSRGIEFASIYHNLGVKIILIEKENRILPRIHPSLANRYRKILTDRKVTVMTRSSVISSNRSGEKGITLTVEIERGKEEIKAEKALLTGFPRPCYSGLNLESAGLSLNKPC